MKNQDKYSGHIAIIGMAGRFPGAANIDQFWQNLCAGRDALRRYSTEETRASIAEHDFLSIPLLEQQVASGNWVAAGYHLEDMDKFDAGFFGYSPKDAELIDPQQRLFLESSWAAMEDSGYVPDEYAGSVGVFGGTGLSRYFLNNVFANREIMLASERDLTAGIGNEPDYLTNRVAYKLNLTGPSVSVQTACSTSLVAIHLACQALRAGECDLALGGGSMAVVPASIGYNYQEGSMNSADGRIRAFDAKASGTVFAEGGVGVIVLKRLEDAEEDDDHIYAVVRGSAVTNDGSRKAGYTAPGIDGQMEVIRRALQSAGTRADEVSYLEAHGTGTALGDPIEITALTNAYRAQTARTQFCAIGSVKTNVGHLAPAAGVASVIKASLAAYHRQLPPTLNYESPNPRIDFAASPFHVVEELSPWQSELGPRVAAISSFGIGGTNAHLVLQEAPARLQTQSESKLRSFVLSAKTAGALGRSAAQLAAHLRAHPELDLDDVAITLQEGRKSMAVRAAIVEQERDALIERLEALAAKPNERGDASGVRPMAFLFTGQGSQYAGMARDLYAAGGEFREQLDACCDAFARHLSVDLKALLLAEHGDAQANETLRQTEYAQPALFALEYALACQLIAWDIRPKALIGHSLGEYVAATLAGVFTLEDAIALVALRGRLMQRMEPGSMMSLPMPLADVQPLLDAEVQLAAVNSPRACVVAGSHAAMDRLAAKLDAQGLVYRRLQTSHAFHTTLMQPMAQEFLAAVARMPLQAPTLPVMSNLSGDWLTPEQAKNPQYWVDHLLSPVMFQQGLAKLLAENYGVLVEAGPGGVLTAFTRHVLGAKDQSSGAVVVALLPHANAPVNAYTTLRQAVADLWVAGAAVDFGNVEADNIGHRIPLPTYPFARERHWLEAPKAPAGGEQSALHRSEDPGSWFNSISWQRQPWLKQSFDFAGARVLLVHQETVSSHVWVAALTESLIARGAEVHRVTPALAFTSDACGHCQIDLAQAEHWTRMAEEAGRPNYVIDLLLLEPAGDQAAMRRLAFMAPLAAVQALADEAGDERMHWLSVGTAMFDVMPGEPLDALKSVALGPHLGLGHEYRKLDSRLLDLPQSLLAQYAMFAQCVLDELALLAATPHAPLVLADKLCAWRAGARWVAGATASQLPAADVSLDFSSLDAPVLITGGTGGIGLSFAKTLAERGVRKLVLVGRKALPPQAQWQQWLQEHTEDTGTAERIRALQVLVAMGVELQTVACDMSDADDVRRMVAEVRASHATLSGVIHAAGVAGSGVMALKTADAANAVLDPKIIGALALDEALADIDLDFFVLVSSLFGVIGGVGQSDYTAANAFLDALARSRSAQGRKMVSLAFGGWREVGMAVAMGHTRSGGTPELPAGRTEDHPFLFARSQEGNRTRFSMHLRVQDHWALQEHRIGGQAVMPGTGFIESIRAAFAVLTHGAALQLDDLYFNRPLMAADDALTSVTIEFTPLGDAVWDVSVDSDMGTLLTATARSTEPQATPQVVDLQALRDLTSDATVDLGGASALLGDPDFLSLGARWQTVHGMRFGDQRMLGELVLPDAYLADLQAFDLHPALLDMATGPISGHLLQRVLPQLESEYLPWRYESLRVHAALTQHLFTDLRFVSMADDEDSIRLDINLIAADGRLLVEIAGFELKRVPPGALQGAGASKAKAQANELAGIVDDGSISPEEGCDALLRVLAHGMSAGHWVFNPHPLEGLMRRMRAERLALAEREAARKTKVVRTDVQTDPPTTPEETILVAIIEGVLGMTPVGIHDNFFDLGIDSVIGIQIVAHAKKHGLILKPAHLFEHQSVAALALVAVPVQAAPAASAAEENPPKADVAPTTVQPAVMDDVLSALGEL